MLNGTEYEHKCDIKRIHRLWIRIDILEYLLIIFGRLFIEITKASLR